MISDKIKIVKNKADLKFNDVSYDRRGFFKALKNVTFTQAAGLFGDEDTGEELRAYSAKKLPFKRELLNRLLKVLPEETKGALLKNYYYAVNVSAACNNCFACIGMCPTGALKIENKEDDRELFSAHLYATGAACAWIFVLTALCVSKKDFQAAIHLNSLM